MKIGNFVFECHPNIHIQTVLQFLDHRLS